MQWMWCLPNGNCISHISLERLCVYNFVAFPRGYIPKKKSPQGTGVILLFSEYLFLESGLDQLVESGSLAVDQVVRLTVGQFLAIQQDGRGTGDAVFLS